MGAWYCENAKKTTIPVRKNGVLASSASSSPNPTLISEEHPVPSQVVGLAKTKLGGTKSHDFFDRPSFSASVRTELGDRFRTL